MIALVWKYRVKPDKRSDFETIYGPSGDWAQLFARADGYLGTELLIDEGGDFLTIDRWDSPAAFERFKARFGADYAALDARCDELTLEEAQIGSFRALE